MKNGFRFTAFLFALAVIVFSCRKESAFDDAYDNRPGKNDSNEAVYAFSIPEDIFGDVLVDQMTKSGAEDGEAFASLIGIYQDGRLVYQNRIVSSGMTDNYGKGAQAGSASLRKDLKYNIYMMTGNTVVKSSEYSGSKYAVQQGLYTMPDLESDLESVCVGYSSLNQARAMVAASGNMGFEHAGSIKDLRPEAADALDGATDGVITVPLKCLWAKMTFKWNTSEVPKKYIRESAINAHQWNTYLYPFASTDAKKSLALGSSTSHRDASAQSLPWSFTGSGPVYEQSFYLPEQMLGELIPNNTDPSAKIPANLPSDYQTRAGYLNILAQYNMPAVVVEGGYKIMPGGNNCSNFDVEGGYEYVVNFTPTRDGFTWDTWKSTWTVSDFRAYMITGVEGYTIGAGGPELILTDVITMVPGGNGWAKIDLKYNGMPVSVDDVAALYDDFAGWEISPDSKELLDELGITYTGGKRFFWYGYGTTLQSGDQDWYDNQRGKTYANTPAYEFGWYCLVTFSGATAEMMGQTIPVVIQSKDGRHSKTLTLTVKESYEGARITSTGGIHVAQQRRISVKNASEVGITKVRFSETSSPRKLSFSGSEFSNPSAEVTVDLLKPGDATVKIEGYRGGSWVTLATQKFTIYKPTLRAVDPAGAFISTALDLSMDGAPRYCKLQYYTKAGKPMQIAGSGENAEGVFFNPALYASLLKPVRDNQSATAAGYVDWNDNALYVAKYSLNGVSTIDNYYNASLSATFHANASDLLITCSVPFRIKAPFVLTSSVRSRGYVGTIGDGSSEDFRLYPSATVFSSVDVSNYTLVTESSLPSFQINGNQLELKEDGVSPTSYGARMVFMRIVNRKTGNTFNANILPVRIYRTIRYYALNIETYKFHGGSPPWIETIAAAVAEANRYNAYGEDLCCLIRVMINEEDMILPGVQAFFDYCGANEDKMHFLVYDGPLGVDWGSAEGVPNEDEDAHFYESIQPVSASSPSTLGRDFVEGYFGDSPGFGYLPASWEWHNHFANNITVIYENIESARRAAAGMATKDGVWYLTTGGSDPSGNPYIVLPTKVTETVKWTED